MPKSDITTIKNHIDDILIDYQSVIDVSQRNSYEFLICHKVACDSTKPQVYHINTTMTIEQICNKLTNIAKDLQATYGDYLPVFNGLRSNAELSNLDYTIADGKVSAPFERDGQTYKLVIEPRLDMVYCLCVEHVYNRNVTRKSKVEYNVDNYFYVESVDLEQTTLTMLTYFVDFEHINDELSNLISNSKNATKTKRFIDKNRSVIRMLITNLLGTLTKESLTNFVQDSKNALICLELGCDSAETLANYLQLSD